MFTTELFGPHHAAEEIEQRIIKKNEGNEHFLKYPCLYGSLYVHYTNLFADYNYLKDQIKKYEESNNKH